MERERVERSPYGFLDAYLRYERAREHLANINELADAFRATKQVVESDYYAEILKELASIGVTEGVQSLPIPLDIPIRVGEFAYNLRCALDYLIFALAWHDSGIEPTERWARRLKFPIESDIKVFERRRATQLKGISDPHIAMVREYQPAEGCVWTGLLADLNDSDKHRHLSVLAASIDTDAEATRWVTITPEIQALEDAGMVVPYSEMNMEVRATFDVVFPDGGLVSETLEELETEVGALLTRFGEEFILHPL